MKIEVLPLRGYAKIKILIRPDVILQRAEIKSILSILFLFSPSLTSWYWQIGPTANTKGKNAYRFKLIYVGGFSISPALT